MRSLLRSTSVRLALIYSGLFVVSSLLLVGFLWWNTAAYLNREVEAVIVADTRAIGDRLRDFGLPGAVETINNRVGQVGDEHAVFLLTDPVLRPIAGNLEAWPAEVAGPPGWYQVELVRGGLLYPTRVLHVVLPGNFHLLVGRDVRERAHIRALIVDGLWWVAASAVLLAVLGGLFVRRAVLARVESINRTANAIVQGDLSRRLPARDTADEFDQLARTINVMLDRIETLIDGVRNTSNAVAHDLRTPLAELRARLEGLLRGEAGREATASGIQDAIGDVDRILEIFNALLRLAELDSGVRRSGFRSVDLASVATEVAELYQPVIAARKGDLVLRALPGLAVLGDPFLLAQAIGNLVDNAVKYAPEGSTVSLIISPRTGETVEIAVTDQGPGIPVAERERVIERFYRGDASRGTQGIGLGLSLVAAVARLHGGSLALADNHPGLRAALVLPMAADGAAVPSSGESPSVPLVTVSQRAARHGGAAGRALASSDFRSG